MYERLYFCQFHCVWIRIRILISSLDPGPDQQCRNPFVLKVHAIDEDKNFDHKNFDLRKFLPRIIKKKHFRKNKPFIYLYQETNMADKEIISSLKEENEFLKQVSNDYENLRYDNLYLTYN